MIHSKYIFSNKYHTEYPLYIHSPYAACNVDPYPPGLVQHLPPPGHVAGYARPGWDSNPSVKTQHLNGNRCKFNGNFNKIPINSRVPVAFYPLDESSNQLCKVLNLMFQNSSCEVLDRFGNSSHPANFNFEISSFGSVAWNGNGYYWNLPIYMNGWKNWMVNVR